MATDSGNRRGSGEGPLGAGRWLRIANLFLTGLLTGAMFEEYLLLKVVIAELPAATWGAVHARFGIVHPVTIIPIALLASLSLLALLAVQRDLASLRGRLTWGALLFFVAVGILTGGVMFPANEIIQQWAQQGPPADWEAVRDRWTTYQGLRATFSVLGFGALCVAACLPAPVSAAPPSGEAQGDRI